MRIFTTAELFNQESQYFYMSVLPVKGLEPKKDFNTGQVQKFGNRALYRLPAHVVHFGEDRNSEVKGITLAALNPNIEMTPGKIYQAKKGTKVAVTPYNRDGQTAYSIVLEDIEETH